MSQLRTRMMQDLELAGYVESTRQKYINSIRKFAKYHRRSPADIGQEEVRAWVEQLRGCARSASWLRGHFAALKFLYAKTLGRPEVVAFLSWPKDPERLPVVLSATQVGQLLEALNSAKYRVFFTTVYAAGLRISEGCQLETGDIDAARGVIHVRHGKGDKERLVMLSPRLLAILRAYWRLERPSAPHLFTSETGGPLNPDTARQALHHAVAVVGLDQKVTPHVLRHNADSRIMPTPFSLTSSFRTLRANLAFPNAA